MTLKPTLYAIACLTLAAGPACAQDDDPYAATASASVAASLAPACGLKDQQWKADALQAMTGGIQALVPGGPFSDGFLDAMTKAEAEVSTAYSIGARLLPTYGKIACSSAILDQDDVQSIDQLVAQYRQTQNGKQITDPADPGGIPAPASALIWLGFIGEIANKCGYRSDDWNTDLGSQLMMDLGHATGSDAPGLSTDDQNAKLNPSAEGYTFAQTLADEIINNAPPEICTKTHQAADLKLADAKEKTFEDNPNPWGNVGK